MESLKPQKIFTEYVWNLNTAEILSHYYVSLLKSVVLLIKLITLCYLIDRSGYEVLDLPHL